MSASNHISKVALVLAQQGTMAEDVLLRFFYTYTAANALFYSRHLAQPQGRCELDAFKRWAAALPPSALAEALGSQAVTDLMERVPFDYRSRCHLPQHRGSVINYYESDRSDGLRYARLDIPTIRAARKANPDEQTVRNATGSLAKVIYTIRCNLFHGHKAFPDERNEELLEQCNAVLSVWVRASLTELGTPVRVRVPRAASGAA
mgnify:CR=1